MPRKIDLFREYITIHYFINLEDPLKSWVNENNFHNIYQEDWNALMPVVEKIEMTSKYDVGSHYDAREDFLGWYPELFTLLPGDEIRGIDLDSFRYKTKLEAMYKAVLEYIKWYNKNKH